MFAHDTAYQLTIVESNVSQGWSIGEAIDSLSSEPQKHAVTAYIVEARQQLPNGSASAVVRCARKNAQQAARI